MSDFCKPLTVLANNLAIHQISDNFDKLKQRNLSFLRNYREQFILPNFQPMFFSINQYMYIDSAKQKWQNMQFRFGRDPRKNSSQRKTVIVLGTGWAAMNFIMNVDVTKYNVVVVSPNNFFAFTPLLPSVCGGTLSARSCLEPVRNKLMRGGKKVMNFYEAWATSVDPAKKILCCKSLNGDKFELSYDYLIMGVGSVTNTFGIPGVQENAYFLKDVSNAREIFKKMLDCFEIANLPTTPEEQKKKLLQFVIVGGGPAGVEIAAEIADFIKIDAARHYPDLVKYATISLIEMLPILLPMYNESISKFTAENFKKMGVNLHMKCRVDQITDKVVHIVDENGKQHELPYGLVVWGSGIGQTAFAKHILSTVEEQKNNRIIRVDEKLRVNGMPDVYAMGDCVYITPKSLAADADKLFELAQKSGVVDGNWFVKNISTLKTEYPQFTEKYIDKKMLQSCTNMSKDEFVSILKEIDSKYRPPATTAQAANQEARYLATIFNHYNHDDKIKAPAFDYNWKGQMAYVGNGQSVIQTPNFGTLLGGRKSNLLWKMFYWSGQLSTTNKFLCLFDWIRAETRGRDVGRDHCKDIQPTAPIA